MKTILLVDDDRDFQELIKHKLGKRFTLVVCENGEEAFETAKDLKPDLILMDIQMPVLNGLATTKKLKDHPETEDIPIMALTALKSDKKPNPLSPFVDYFTKPIQLNKLEKRIDDIFKLWG